LGIGWKKLDRLLRRVPQFPSILDQAMRAQAEMLQEEIVEGIKSGAPGGVPFAPLAPSTIRRKGHSAPLQETRTLLRNITVRRMRGEGVIVGYEIGPRPRAMHPKGRGATIADVGEFHEQAERPNPRNPRRAFMAPVLAAKRAEIVRAIRATINRFLTP
jgi:hypothetical protein